MPLLLPARDFIDVHVSDRTPGVTQTARWLSMLAQQDPISGQVEVHLQVQVSQADAEGNPLSGKGIIPYKVPLVANNNTAVDPATGELRYLLLTEASPPSVFLPDGAAGKVLNLLTGEKEDIAPGQSWLLFLDSKPEQLLLQGDSFAGLMVQMGITPLLRQFMEQADQPPFSKFV